jgi:hypothetical protein
MSLTLRIRGVGGRVFSREPLQSMPDTADPANSRRLKKSRAKADTVSQPITL